MTGVFISERRGRFDAQRQRAKAIQRQRWTLCLHKPRDARSHQKLEEARRDCPPEPSEGTQPC